MQNSLEHLDAEELYHLALKASEKGDHEGAIVMLKQSITQKPNANTQYILAAEHAEIGMYERAAEEMVKATELDDTLWTAHFQLGLLYMMLNKMDDAINTWDKLKQLDESDALHLFGKGMTALLQDQLEDAAKHIEHGIALNLTNPALNANMESVLSNLYANMNLANADEKEKEEETASKQTKAEDAEKRKANPIFLASYDERKDSERWIWVC